MLLSLFQKIAERLMTLDTLAKFWGVIANRRFAAPQP